MVHYIFGDGPHALEVAELLKLHQLSEVKMLNSEEEFLLNNGETLQSAKFFIGVGLPENRISILNRWNGYLDNFQSVAHSNSYVSGSSMIGAGVIIQFGVVVSVNTEISSGALLNWNSSIGHDCKIGRGSVINPGASISGNCDIGEGVLVGTGARILQGIRVGAHSVIGAGAVVTKDVDPFRTVVGVPAKELLKNE